MYIYIIYVYTLNIRDRYHRNIYISGLNNYIIFETIQNDGAFHVFEQKLAEEMIENNIEKADNIKGNAKSNKMARYFYRGLPNSIFQQ